MTWLSGVVASLLSPANIVHDIFWVVVGTIMMDQWRRWFNRTPGRRRQVFFWVLSFLSLYIAIAAVQALSRAASKPDLSGSIDFTISGTASDGEPGTIAMITGVSLRNHGGPTVAEGFRASAEFSPETAAVAGKMRIVPQSITMDSGGSRYIFSGGDALYSKALDKPIEKGSAIRGILIFSFEGVSQETLNRPGTIIKVQFEDIEGKTYTLVNTMTGRRSEIQYYPGLRMGFGQTPAPPTPAANAGIAG